MCGRYSLTLDAEDIIEMFLIDEFLAEEWRPRYNIAPSQKVLGAVEVNGKRRAGYFYWGLTPKWIKEPQKWKPLINARSESLLEKISFKDLVNKRRCILFADGFYEWRRKGQDKQPFRFFRKDKQPFAFAALWDVNEVSGEKKPSCTILTTSPNEMVGPIHDRMPVILKEEQLSLWLDHQVPYEQIQSQLAPYPADEMDVYQVSEQVNSPKNDHPSILQKI
ncbi:MAG TPA: SOS response-associated peptidase [Bacillus sp. (in: firmicutes)]|uniref:SOS response-associated peptidase n=1 Tax=Bacillus litorisediminis TaxID=2922713 RepID=UPI001FAB72EF|nr:SOS response-associated peptidase [Bacillus litorisediminis]HWO76301.1 SOS response-associated peptidase [Bacillus sp. (in: firmicutes)]